MPCNDRDKLLYNIRELPEVFNIEPVDLFVVETLDGTSIVSFDNIIIDLPQTTFEVAFNKHTTDIIELSGRLTDNIDPRLQVVEAEVGIINDSLGSTIDELSGQVSDEIERINGLPNVAGYIAFDGGTGNPILARNLTVQKDGTGQYTIILDPSIRRGNSNYCVVLGNVDRGVASQALRGGEIQGTLDVYNTFVEVRNEASFGLRAIRHYEGPHIGGQGVAGNDFTHITRFGIAAAEPAYITLAIYT